MQVVEMPNWEKHIMALISKMWDLMILESVLPEHWVFSSDGNICDISCLDEGRPWHALDKLLQLLIWSYSKGCIGFKLSSMVNVKMQSLKTIHTRAFRTLPWYLLPQSLPHQILPTLFLKKFFFLT